MHRSWSLLSLAFIVLISLSSMNPQLRSRTSPPLSNKVTFTWAKIERFSAPIAGPYELQSELTRSQNQIRDLVLEAADVLGLDISSPPKVEHVYEGGVNFQNAYRNGFVKFQILGGTKTAGKEVIGMIYVGTDETIIRRWKGVLTVDGKRVFPKSSE
ncbi:hypothetical protein F5050DRAFT_1716062 [Lentinula boryana]|uniref:Uncharacterized protein n=1 Tax=Lentinula boryana TaxID=40481 RepID=A0ABQ8Q194_9AGAR|nr:hypothetical protein F5050DRAFT_1716062 [Lentinula boryana]